MKCFNIFCFYFLFIVSQLSAQVFDNFDDGDFLNQPSWVGHADSFVVFNNQLRLNANNAGRSYLAVSSGLFGNHEWKIYVRFDLSPSLQNNCRFYLISNQQDLTSSLNGYYVQLGGSTGNTDTISLNRQDGLIRTRIIAGRASTVSKAQNIISLRILRDSTGKWDLFSDTTGSGSLYAFEGTIIDTVYKSSLFSGILCQYTSSNKANFYFDNFYSGPFYIDSIPPKVDSFSLVTNKQILIRFNEVVNSTTAQLVDNYVINGGVKPLLAVLQPDKRTVLLTFAQSFISGQFRTLVCDGIEDLAGNVMHMFSQQFLFFEPSSRDVVINELMADPSPIVGLPNAEFIELFNRSGFDINLKNWQITDGSSTAFLPDVVLRADSNLIVCATSAAADFSGVGRVVGVASFPSLNNSGDSITLISDKFIVIDNVRYTDAWYRDELKRQGGWTLEQINPNHPCSDFRNWTAAVDFRGGTPGKQNSVFSNASDTFPPAVLTKGYWPALRTLYFLYDEKIDSLSFTSCQITIDNGLTISARVLKNDTVFLTLDAGLTDGLTYTITFTGIADCWGNQRTQYKITYRYIVPQKPVLFGVLMTEILSDETPIVGLPDAEFVELYNASPYAINLSGWTISDATGKGTLPSYILDSGAYVILCGTSSVAKFAGLTNVLGVPSFPSLSNDGELLVLRDEAGKVIHFIQYSIDWHADGLKKSGGWSLEMTDVSAYCVGAGNWQSSIHPKGGTPGSVNSIQKTFIDNIKPELIRAYLVDSLTLVLQFSKSVDSSSVFSPNAFKINPFSGSYTIYGFSSDFKSFRIQFSTPLSIGQVYTIRADSIKDCTGNLIHNKKGTARFAIPDRPDSSDIIINELLFNPRSGGYDFVEVYNRSTKTIDIGRFMLADTDEQNNIENFYRVSDAPLLLFGGEYLALTENASRIRQDYFCLYPDRVQEVLSLPSMSDDEGVIVILDSTGKRFDQVKYADDWHHPQVDDKNGVSLERINPSFSSQDKNNWTSAASTAGYGTPGYQNSQFNLLHTSDKTVFIAKDIFSPDGDGYDDELVIQYALDKPGYTCTFNVYTAQGMAVKRVLNNELLGTTGIIKWRGDTESSGISLAGMYVLVFEFQHPSGSLKVVKKTCVLALK